MKTITFETARRMVAYKELNAILYFDIQLLISDPPYIANRLEFDCTPKGKFLGLHVKPGGTYRSDKDGQMHRYQDENGSRNRQGEDFHMGASAGETHVHFHIAAIDGASVHSFLG
jgi:hypothetical protein